ncbi:uncharacterized protein LOC142893421 isoform X2 [Nelusetta ayraudi]|uniref:uncharacterized protein LOC142893421 isoform X2 n=1 Tax=Nelusetta ayraudi TaxID=303726 RepID=UPI003F71475D
MMGNVSLITALIFCCISWIFVSGSESQTVEVQLGANVTLQCSNVSRSATHTQWFRVVNRTKPSCVSSMFYPQLEDSLCPGFTNGKFKMTSNISHVFLKINPVDFSDSGLYFCGLYINKFTVISSITLLNVQDEPTGMAKLPMMILGGLTLILLIVIVALAFKVKRLQRDVKEITQRERNKNAGCENQDHGAFKYLPQTIRNRKPEPGVETCVLYKLTEKLNCCSN